MGTDLSRIDGAESRMINEPVIVKMIKIIKKHRSITSAINRQPSLS